MSILYQNRRRSLTGGESAQMNSNVVVSVRGSGVARAMPPWRGSLARVRRVADHLPKAP